MDVAISKEQIKLFHSLQEMETYLESNSPQLHRIQLADVPSMCSLDLDEHSYIGGQVLSVMYDSYSQGHGALVFVEDAGVPSSGYNLILKIDGQLIELMPSVDSEYMVFVTGAIYFEDEEVEYSQDTGKRVIVEGSKVEVMVIHPRIDDPQRYVKVCGPRWWKRRKKMKEYLRRTREMQQKQLELSQQREQNSQLQQAEEDGPSHAPGMGEGPSHAHAMDHSVEPGSTMAGECPRPPPQEHFPDDDDFPESAFGSSNEESESSSSSCEDASPTWNPKSTSTHYTYTKLADLQPGLKKVSVIAVVKEFTEPQITRGTDFCTVMTLVDESNPHVGIKCIVFQSNKERLPCVKREGDIICLHRVNTNEHRNVMQIEGPKYSSSLRFSSKVGRGVKPCTGCVSYTFTSVERRRVRELRKWLLKDRRSTNTQKLESIGRDYKFNLLCQVVWMAHSCSTNQTTLSVWDGTMCPISLKSRVFDNADISTSQSLMDSVGPEFQQQITFQGKLSSRTKVKPGSYVFITNIEASSQHGGGTLELCVDGHIRQSIEIVSVREYGHSELKDQLNFALQAQPVVTTISHSDIGCSTLLHISNTPVQEGAPVKFCCKAKLVRIITPSLEDMVRLHCDQCGLFEVVGKSAPVDESGISNAPCHVCYDAGQWLPESVPPTCMYLVQLLLRDNTGSLVVHLPHAEAIKLFHGLQPTNFYQHQAQRYKLLKMVYQLSGDNAPFSQQQAGGKIRPWITCCLLKVLEGTKTYYCIFDTAINTNP